MNSYNGGHASNIIQQILPLIFNYMCDPFNLICVNKTINRASVKYPITLQKIGHKLHDLHGLQCHGLHCYYLFFNKRLIKKYKFKTLELKYNIGHTLCDSDLQYLSNIENLYLGEGYNISDDGLKYLQHVKKLSFHYSGKITNTGLTYLKNITELNLYSNQNITHEGISILSGVIFTNMWLHYLRRKI